MMKKLFPCIILLIIIVLGGCGSDKSEDVGELLRIRSELKNLDDLEQLMAKGLLKPEMISFLGEDLSLERPQEIRAAFSREYLTLFRDYLNQLEYSTLDTIKDEDPARFRKLEQRQMDLRVDLLETFYTKLYRLEGEELESLFDVFRSVTPKQARLIQYQISGMGLIYYKNIPEITTTIKADETTFVIIKVDLGYEMGNKKMQTIINMNKLAMTDLLRSYCSGLTLDDLDSVNEFAFKSQLIVLLNKQLLQYDKTGQLKGIQDVAVIKLQTFELR